MSEPDSKMALLTTASALAVAIPCYLAYNYLVARIDAVMRKLETGTMEFLDLLNEPA